MKKVHVIVVSACVLFLLACSLFVPFDTELVPVWSMTVVAENDEPLPHIAIEESWKHYAYPESRFPDAHGWETRRSDENGVVIFPPKNLRASIASRLFFPVLATIGQLAHGSSSLEINARVYDPAKNYFSRSENMIFHYSGQHARKPLPNTIIATPGD